VVSFPSEFNSLNSGLPSQQRYALRPLSTGEVLDRTFQLYRARFWLFAGISAFVPAVNVVLTIVKLFWIRHHGTAGAAAQRSQYAMIIFGLLAWAFMFVLYGVANAASVSAISNVYLGRETSVASAYRAAKEHWLRYVLVALAQLWSAGWLPILLLVAMLGTLLARRHAGHLDRTGTNITIGLFMLAVLVSMAYAIWAYLRVSLAMPASVVEDVNARAALRRSKKLLVDRKFRILLLMLLLMCLYFAVAAVQIPVSLLLARSHGSAAGWLSAITLIVQFVTGTLVTPLGAIGLCLFYIDERVRREGFDIEWMLTGSAGALASDQA
jgi:hypothetical protein